jgi:nucleotide-binding universal stress UspA family protein
MILEVAQQAQADLVVMGAHRGAAVTAHVPCAIAHQVVCHAFCPVLTVSWPKTAARTGTEAA